MTRGEEEGSVVLDVDDREAIASLRTALRRARYDAPSLRTLLHAEGDNLTPRPSDIPVITRLLPPHDPLATIATLFLLGLPVKERDAAKALAPLALSRAVRLGIVRRQSEGVRARVRILPAGELAFACDLSPEGSPDLPADHVMGVSTSSIHLASLTVRRPVTRALDVGSGCGIQSVLAARHAERVVACDINPRALNFTAFNALLNEATNVECRAGSFFEPVAGESFDLIVSNPPFVISPEAALAFRDAGMRGHDVSRLVVRESAKHLRDGGLAFVLVSWGVARGEEWSAPLRAWAEGLGCDAWFLQQSQETAIGYAASWNGPLQTRPAEFGAALDRWTRYLRRLGFETVGYGAAIVRRRPGPNWFRADELAGQRAPASGAQVERLLRAQDYLSGLADPRGLLAATLRLVPQHRLDQALRVRDGQFTVEAAVLRLEEGFRFEAVVDAFSAHLLEQLDGTRTLDDAIARTAERFASDGLSRSDFAEAALPVVRRMVALGFVEVASP